MAAVEPDIKQIDSTTATNLMSISSLEYASSFWAITTVVLTGILAISGALAWYFADQLGKTKDDKLKRFQTESKLSVAGANARAAESGERAAKADERAAKLKLELERLTSPGFEKFNREAFRDKIRGKPKMRVELLFQENDVDSYMLGMAVKGCLEAEGWTVLGPRPIREEDVNFSEISKDAPLSVRAGLGLGAIAYVTKQRPPFDDLNNPVNVLLSAFNAAKGGPGVESSTAFGGTYDSTLPDDLIRLMVGPKYHEW